ncbi:Gfo/Idh/MocA family oxidoreductase, partial [Candidatus Bathyarchaeota archaeon]
MQPLQISVVGAGYWGKKVIREILNLAKTTGKVSLSSVVDNSPSILEQCAKEFGPLTYHLNYRDLLSDPYVSAVHICSPNASHFEIASEFLRSKKDVLVEKPLALRTREAYELVRLAETNSRVLSTGHLHRFNNGVKELKRVVDSGVLGDIYYLRLQWTGLLPPQKERDVITDLGPHPFDICNDVLGSWPSKISCRGRGYRTRTGDEVAFITADYLNGIVANIELSWLDHEKRRDVTVVGSDAVATLDCLDQKLVLQRPDGTEPVSVAPSNTLGEEILHFADCVEQNRKSAAYANLASGAIGASVVRLLEASK